MYTLGELVDRSLTAYTTVNYLRAYIDTYVDTPVFYPHGYAC